MRLLPVLLLFAAAAALSVRAEAAGLNLSWNDCGDYGECNQSFACNTNGPGAFTLVGSFVPPAGITQFSGEEIVVDFMADTGDHSMPSWWQFKNSGSCRLTAVTANADFTSSTGNCVDYWQGQAAGGMGSWRYGSAIYSGYPENYGRLLLVFAVVPSLRGPMDPLNEYYAFNLVISKAKTVGTGACAGCSTPAAFHFSSARLTQPAGVGDYFVNGGQERAFATWQSGMYNVWDVGYRCPEPVNARNRTWGSIKSLYR